MLVSAWSGGNGTYGIRIGVPNRERWFDHSWREIDIELDGQFRSFKLTDGFWRKCPEFRDSGHNLIRDWLRRHRTLNWNRGSPPKMELMPLGGQRFRLLADPISN